MTPLQEARAPQDGRGQGVVAMEITTNTLALGFGVGEAHPNELASHAGCLYMVGQSTALLYTLNPTMAWRP